MVSDIRRRFLIAIRHHQLAPLLSPLLSRLVPPAGATSAGATSAGAASAGATSAAAALAAAALAVAASAAALAAY
jgi:hypothetical protein